MFQIGTVSPKGKCDRKPVEGGDMDGSAHYMLSVNAIQNKVIILYNVFDTN